jgi:hypothetical protein
LAKYLDGGKDRKGYFLMKTQRIFLAIGMLALALSFGLSTISCATVSGVPYSAETENEDIAIYANSRDFLANNYAAAYRSAAQEGYTKVLHWENVKLGPFGIFGLKVRLTAVQP